MLVFEIITICQNIKDPEHNSTLKPTLRHLLEMRVKIRIEVNLVIQKNKYIWLHIRKS